MKQFLLFVILVITLSSASGFSVRIFEPLSSMTIMYYTTVGTTYGGYSTTPMGAIYDVFMDQFIPTNGAQLHTTSQFYSGNGVIPGPINEVCDANGGINQLFNTISYPVANPFPGALLGGGAVNILPSDLFTLGLVPPSGLSFVCWPGLVAKMIIVPNSWLVAPYGANPLMTTSWWQGTPGAPAIFYMSATTNDPGQNIDSLYLFELTTMTLVAYNNVCGTTCSLQYPTQPNKIYLPVACQVPSSLCSPGYTLAT